MHPSRVATRVNAVETEHFAADIAAVVCTGPLLLRSLPMLRLCTQMKIPTISTIVLPKVHSAADLDVVAEAVNAHATDAKELSLVASIESARALWRVGDIAGWCSSHRRDGVQLRVRALLVSLSGHPSLRHLMLAQFAAEDCTFTSLGSKGRLMT
jgi:citrate lyase beta subunit